MVRPNPRKRGKSLSIVVIDPENCELEELVQMYLDEGLDWEHAETYAKVAKNPPGDVRVE
ncbi:hypothetical protein GCM10009551_011850 [Nocardiopsis tropica]